MVFGPSICSAEVPASIARKFQGFGQQLQRRSAIHFNQQTTCFGKKNPRRSAHSLQPTTTCFGPKQQQQVRRKHKPSSV